MTAAAARRGSKKAKRRVITTAAARKGIKKTKRKVITAAAARRGSKEPKRLVMKAKRQSTLHGLPCFGGSGLIAGLHLCTIINMCKLSQGITYLFWKPFRLQIERKKIIEEPVIAWQSHPYFPYFLRFKLNILSLFIHTIPDGFRDHHRRYSLNFPPNVCLQLV